MAKDKTTDEPTTQPANVVWNGRGEMPPAIHGLTVDGQAITIEIPAAALSKDGKGVPFFSPYAGVLVGGVEGFERYTPGETKE